MTTPNANHGCSMRRVSAQLSLRIESTQPEQPAPFRLGYRRWLDGLRGLAILAVLAFHFRLLVGGFLGVDLFFVLSGFLITTLLVQEWSARGSISLKRFYLRRVLRLWPGLFTLLLICGLASLWVPSAEKARGLRQEVIVAGCYITNWPALHNTPMQTLGYTWSLSLEEQFYLLWPLLLYGMLWLGLARGWILFLVCGGMVTSATVRAALYAQPVVTEYERAAAFLRTYMGLDTRADALLAGCLVGLLAAWGLLPSSAGFQRGIKIAAAVCAAYLAFLFFRSHLGQVKLFYGRFTLVALMSGAVLVHLISCPSRLAILILEFPPLVIAGRLSYSLYLFHIPILRLLGPIDLGWRYPGNTLLVAVLTLAVAAVSYHCIESPFLRLKDRLQARDGVAPAKSPKELGDRDRTASALNAAA